MLKDLFNRTTPFFRDALGVLVACAVFFWLGMYVGPAHGEVLVARGTGQSLVRLMQTPCASKAVLDLIKVEHRSNFHAAEAHVSAGLVASCWILTDDQQVFMVFETGESTQLPTSAFKLEEGA